MDFEGTVAGALARGLVRHKVATVFGQSLPSALHLACKGVGIKQTWYRTENGGGAMADAFARISGKVGVVTAQNGPAATLLVPPLAEALKASVPIVALVQEVALNQTDKNAFQEYDHLALFGACTKWVRRLDQASRADDYLDMALPGGGQRQAGTGRPAAAGGPSFEPGPARSGAPEPKSGRVPLRAHQAGKGLFGAGRGTGWPGPGGPLIIAGGGVHLSGACAELAALQEKGGLARGHHRDGPRARWMNAIP